MTLAIKIKKLGGKYWYNFDRDSYKQLFPLLEKTFGEGRGRSAPVVKFLKNYIYISELFLLSDSVLA